jgi:hypothetical protein
MEMTLIKISGKMEEIQELAPKLAQWFAGGDGLTVQGGSKADSNTPTDKTSEIATDLVRRMLTRHPPLEVNHKAFLASLYGASDWISAKAICR